MGAFTCAMLIAAGLPAAQAVTIDSSLSRDVFQGAFAAGFLFDQNFDLFAAGTTLKTVNGVTFSPSKGSAAVTSDFLATTPPNSLGSTSSGYFASDESISISFAKPLTAFAIDINTFAPARGDYVAELNNGSTVASRVVYFGESSFGQFLGFTSDEPFTSVAIRPVIDPDEHVRFPYTLDTLIFGDAAAMRSVAPEPSAWVFLASGLALLLFSRLRILKTPRAATDGARDMHAPECPRQ